MATSKSLKTAVKSEVKEAKQEVSHGNVETVPETKGGPATDAKDASTPADLATGARSRR